MNQKRCPISYNLFSGDALYSPEGLAQLSRNLKQLSRLPWSAQDLLVEAAKHATKMSVQGMQPKLSAKLNAANNCFDIVDQNGRYILKPPLPQYKQVPENEDLTMRLAKIVGIETPLHGLLYNLDHSFTYFIKRFDRYSHSSKRMLEDFGQLSSRTREVKYNSSMEEIVKIIDSYCTFPMIEKKKLLLMTLFNFLTGNEDMHLKNFSLITINSKIQLSPAYDLLNTTIVTKATKEELALPLNGRKNNLRKKDFIQYFAIERMGLNTKVALAVLAKIEQALPAWFELLENSFLSNDLQNEYREILHERIMRLGLSH